MAIFADIHFSLVLMGFWVFCIVVLFLLRLSLLRKTWNEPYFSARILVIESDDWGPGGQEEVEGLSRLLEVLRRHKDSRGRPPVMTANVVLSVPDGKAIGAESYEQYKELVLKDDFEGIYGQLRRGQEEGILHPQLHGLTHIYPTGLLRLGRQENITVRSWLECGQPRWKELPHPLQAHYIDGTKVPSARISFEEQVEMVQNAMRSFRDHFGFNSVSTVAPCYLWDENTEQSWKSVGIRYIQTAGYRCTGLNAEGKYIQAPFLIRHGDRNKLGQVYLVRNVMYEPSDCPDADNVCWQGVLRAFHQGLPAIICTHEYNYSRSYKGSIEAIDGLDRVLQRILERYPDVIFLNTEEVGFMTEEYPQLLDKSININNLLRARCLLFRLWFRHKKIRYVSIVTLIIVPALIFILLTSILTSFINNFYQQYDLMKPYR